MDSKAECERRAKALAKRLGHGWKPRVWENLGWHWSVQKGPLTVSEFNYRKVNPKLRGVSYHALLTDLHGFPGTGRWTGRGSTPETAVDNVIEAARNEADEILQVLAWAGGAGGR